MHPAWMLFRLLLAPLPPGAFIRVRTRLLRLYGLSIGRGTVILGTPTFVGAVDPRRQVRIGERCMVNWPVYFDVNDKIVLGAQVDVGHHAVFITASHIIGGTHSRAGDLQTKPILVEHGAWIGACVTILPGVTIGAGSIVAAGSVVVKDVMPNTLVGGVPARLIRNLDVAEPE